MLGDAMNILKKYDSESSTIEDGLLSKFLTYSKPDITYLLSCSLFEKDPPSQKKRQT